MAWTIEYSETARKNIRRLDRQARARIQTLMEGRVALLENPRDTGKALQGPLSAYWVYRAGDYRVICDIQDDRLVVLVIVVGNRRDVYQ